MHDRKKYPAPFELAMIGPEGHYRLAYTACDATDGKIDVENAGLAMTWFVEIVSQKDQGVTLSGMTTGSQAIWQDQFWFELWPDAHPARIDYWSNQIL